MAEMTTYQQYIHQSRYARWLPEKGRRETWSETVSRYCEFFANRFPDLADEIRGEIRESIERMDTMPSMRSLMTAGPALELENMAGYNCSYISVDNKRAFSEALYVLMCGTGVGFSCERQEIKKLPEIASEMRDCDDLIVVEDSRIGWAKAYQRLISHLYAGDIPKTDFSRIRPKGAPLKTFGGRASGPEPLERLFANTIRMFRNAAGLALPGIFLKFTAVCGGEFLADFILQLQQEGFDQLSIGFHQRFLECAFWLSNQLK